MEVDVSADDVSSSAPSAIVCKSSSSSFASPLENYFPETAKTIQDSQTLSHWETLKDHIPETLDIQLTGLREWDETDPGADSPAAATVVATEREGAEAGQQEEAAGAPEEDEGRRARVNVVTASTVASGVTGAVGGALGGVAAGTTVAAAMAPAATVCGSALLGQAAVGAGLMAAAAPPLWPVLAGALAIGAAGGTAGTLIGYFSSKAATRANGRGQRSQTAGRGRGEGAVSSSDSLREGDGKGDEHAQHLEEADPGALMGMGFEGEDRDLLFSRSSSPSSSMMGGGGERTQSHSLVGDFAGRVPPGSPLGLFPSAHPASFGGFMSPSFAERFMLEEDGEEEGDKRAAEVASGATGSMSGEAGRWEERYSLMPACLGSGLFDSVGGTE
uniref:Uncharacterized protein n=1 Tax=Chromera velia CCMP2878 TaxID=1169474 RepID=A0A0G4HCT4_9ALVE|eukprot:Cvel_6363.t1-p1 / transcript=Cvel_6363.t1 / gene=Cvel_6363 / organism=Chromera_velia_CCMP2878 / gene_product=hypothetical protein / transcript_product=hypothetical protein / location=Cvel_scaffold309:96741-98455(-) / protein_length=387 / sequence_SO=supercontig / SO=protein_coding / is_pseudo=false